MSVPMDLTMQFVEDYREIEGRIRVLEREKATLRDQLDRLERVASDKVIRQIEPLVTERDRLKLENLQLRQDASVWRRRYEDLALE